MKREPIVVSGKVPVLFAVETRRAEMIARDADGVVIGGVTFWRERRS